MTSTTDLSIAIVIHDFALGGTERIALRLARAWADQGARVTIFCGTASGPLASLPGEAVTMVEASPPIPRGRGSRAKLGRAAAVQLEEHPADILFLPGNFHWPVVRHVAALRGSRPRIVAQISAALRKPQRGVIRQWLFDIRMARLLRRADALVAMSDDARSCAATLVDGPRVVTIPTPALDDDSAPPLPFMDGHPILLAVGRLVPEKGFGTLIEAFARCRNRDTRLVIAGSGPDEARLHGLAKRFGVADRVDLPGYVASSRKWLDRARLFILSSWFEGFPAVLVEALAAGRPVVATDCTPAAALLTQHDGAGQVVPTQNVAALAEAIDAMLERTPPDPQALADLVSVHRIGPVASQYLALFEQVQRP